MPKTEEIEAEADTAIQLSKWCTWINGS
jgi:hypothetical protein